MTVTKPDIDGAGIFNDPDHCLLATVFRRTFPNTIHCKVGWLRLECKETGEKEFRYYAIPPHISSQIKKNYKSGFYSEDLIGLEIPLTETTQHEKDYLKAYF